MLLFKSHTQHPLGQCFSKENYLFQALAMEGLLQFLASFLVNVCKKLISNAKKSFRFHCQLYLSPYITGSSSSAHINVRVGLQGEDFLRKSCTEIFHLFGLQFTAKGGLLNLSDRSVGVGVKDDSREGGYFFSLILNSYINLPHLTDQNDVRVGG